MRTKFVKKKYGCGNFPRKHVLKRLFRSNILGFNTWFQLSIQCPTHAPTIIQYCSTASSCAYAHVQWGWEKDWNPSDSATEIVKSTQFNPIEWKMKIDEKKKNINSHIKFDYKFQFPLSLFSSSEAFTSTSLQPGGSEEWNWKQNRIGNFWQ